jgi:hypothetical protein
LRLANTAKLRRHAATTILTATKNPPASTVELTAALLKKSYANLSARGIYGAAI